MLRCAVLAVLVTVLAAPASAQAPRNFPSTALRGVIVVVQPPDVLLNGQPARLAPGARIRGQNNLLQVPGAFVGQKLIANYTIDTFGLILDVWLLRADEAARQPWPTSVAQAAAWKFDAVAQTWSPP